MLIHWLILTMRPVFRLRKPEPNALRNHIDIEMNNESNVYNE